VVTLLGAGHDYEGVFAMRFGRALFVAALLLALGTIAVACSDNEGEPGAPEAPSTERMVAAVSGALAEAEGVRITLNETADPWVSPSEFALDESVPGKRFVAFDVTLEWVEDSGFHYACSTEFTLTDTAEFVYEHEPLFDLEPELDCVHLGSGQKTRGWIGFEVDEGTPLGILKYDPDIFTTEDIEFHFQ
jgi:hypothetical protein